jgi:hypothetical protein
MSSRNNTTTATNVQQMQDRLQQAADIRIQELAAAQSLNLDVTSKRPRSTKSTWSGKQLEFFKWNTSKGYTDELITEHKFLLFLTEIKGRPAYKRGKKRRNSGGQIENIPDSVGWHTLDGYVCAIMDIWKTQHTLGKYPANFPLPTRPPCIRDFLQNAKKDVVANENSTFVDRGLHTIADEVSSNDLQNMCLHFWKKDDEEGLKCRADFLASYALVSRGDNLRNIRLSEIGHKSFPEEGVCGAELMRTVWRKSKKNQFGKFEQTEVSLL